MPAPKGNQHAKGCTTNGRPTTYKKEYCDKVDDYLAIKKDEQIRLLTGKSDKNESYENKLKVSLPTIKGYGQYIGISIHTMDVWMDKYIEFSRSLDKIRVEQHNRLIDSGLSGDYNPTIAKLLLQNNHGYKDRKDNTSGDKPIEMQTKIEIVNTGVPFANSEDEIDDE